METPTSNQSHRIDQGRTLLGPAALRTCPLASPLSQVRARLGPGGYYRCSGNGRPQTYLLAACCVAQPVAQYDPSSSTNTQDPHEGPSLAGRTIQGLLGGGLTRQAPEEAERSRQGVPREVLVTQAMTIKTRRAPGGRQAGANLHRALVSSLVQRGQAHARSTEASGKGSISVQQDQDQQDDRMEVIVEPKTASPPDPFAGEDHFC